MGAMTVADEFQFPVPAQRIVALVASRDRRRRMTSQRDAVPSYLATTTSTSGFDIECKYVSDH